MACFRHRKQNRVHSAIILRHRQGSCDGFDRKNIFEKFKILPTISLIVTHRNSIGAIRRCSYEDRRRNRANLFVRWSNDHRRMVNDVRNCIVRWSAMLKSSYANTTMSHDSRRNITRKYYEFNKSSQKIKVFYCPFIIILTSEKDNLEEIAI